MVSRISFCSFYRPIEGNFCRSHLFDIELLIMNTILASALV